MRTLPALLALPLLVLRLTAVAMPVLVAAGVLHLSDARGAAMANVYQDAPWPALALAVAGFAWNTAFAVGISLAVAGFHRAHPRGRAALAGVAGVTLVEALLRVVAVPVLLRFAPDAMSGVFGSTSMDDVCCCLPIGTVSALALLVSLAVSRPATPNDG